MCLVFASLLGEPKAWGVGQGLGCQTSYRTADGTSNIICRAQCTVKMEVLYSEINGYKKVTAEHHTKCAALLSARPR